MRNLILSALLLASAFQTALGEQSGDWTYSVENNQATITGYTGVGGAVTIPSEVNGVPVVKFGGSYPSTLFGRPNTSVTSVTISNGVKIIGDFAFYGCSGLTTLTIPNSVTSIGCAVFYECTSLTSIIIPNSVTSIGEYAFWNCSGLSSITIPNSVTAIAIGTFSGCTGLTTLTIPHSVTSIGDNAFDWCSGLTTLTIPNSVTSIGENAFWNCSSLTSITIPNSVTSMGPQQFYYCTSLVSLAIPNTVMSSGDWSFRGCSSLTSVIIPDGVTGISDSAFFGCSGLTSISIPNSVTSIGDWAFSYCISLTSLAIGNSVTSIGYHAFQSCTSLTSVTIPNSVTSIGNYAFIDCASLTSITIGNSVTSIGGEAFRGCSGLTSITIPNSVTGISDSAFFGCSGLTSISIPNSVTSIGTYAFSECSSLTSITIPDGVTGISYSAFSGCSGLTSITIPNSVTRIEPYAFRDCASLTSITIGNSVTSIGGEAFRGCTSLASITIPASVKYLFSEFTNCPRLERILVDPLNENYTSVDGVLLNKSLTTVYVIPEGKKTVIIPSSVRKMDYNAWHNWAMKDIYFLGDLPHFLGANDGDQLSFPLETNIYVRADAVGWPTTEPFKPLYVTGYQETISTEIDLNINYQMKVSINPQKYYVDNIPSGLALDDKTGKISGQTGWSGDYSCYTLAVGEAGRELGLIKINVDKKTPKIIVKPTAEKNFFELENLWEKKNPVGGVAECSGVFKWINTTRDLNKGKWEYEAVFISYDYKYKDVQVSIPVYVRERPYFKIESKDIYIAGKIKYDMETKTGTLNTSFSGSQIEGSATFSYSVLSSDEISIAPFLFKVWNSYSEIPIPNIKLKRQGKIYSTVISLPDWDSKVRVTITDNNDEDNDKIPDISDLVLDKALSITSDLSTVLLNIGSNYTYQIVAEGPPTSFGARGLPAGLKVNSATGLISGKPSKTGSYTVTLQALKKGSATATATKVFTVVQVPAFSYAATINAKRNSSVNVRPKVAGYPAPTFSLVSGSLPPGLSLNSSTAAITGKPTTAGTYSITVRGMNSAGNTDRSTKMVVW